MSDLSPRDRLVQQMESRLVAEVERRRRVRKKRRLAIGASSVIFLSLAVSAWVWLVAPLLAERGARCFSAADMSAPYVEVAFADEAEDKAIKIDAPETHAAQLCAALWEGGLLGDPRPNQPLFVCRASDGALQVFPREPGEPENCSALGIEESDGR